MEVIEGKARAIKIQTETNSKYINSIVDALVGKYNRELDELMNDIRTELNSKREINERLLEDWTLKIPVYMYFAGSGLELLGIEGDNAKAIKMEAYAQAHQVAVGTVSDKESSAKLATMHEHLINDAFQRAYKKLGRQLDNATHTYNAVKKLMDKRLEEKILNARDKGK